MTVLDAWFWLLVRTTKGSASPSISSAIRPGVWTSFTWPLWYGVYTLFPAQGLPQGGGLFPEHSFLQSLKSVLRSKQSLCSTPCAEHLLITRQGKYHRNVSKRCCKTSSNAVQISWLSFVSAHQCWHWQALEGGQQPQWGWISACPFALNPASWPGRMHASQGLGSLLVLSSHLSPNPPGLLPEQHPRECQGQSWYSRNDFFLIELKLNYLFLNFIINGTIW